MNYFKQFGILLFFSFLGEILHALIPLPIPASIYGMVLLFLALCTHVIQLSSVREVSLFLVELMPVMFVPAAVGLMDAWDVIRADLPVFLIVLFIVTFVVMGVSGKVSQAVMRKSEKKHSKETGETEEQQA